MRFPEKKFRVVQQYTGGYRKIGFASEEVVCSCSIVTSDVKVDITTIITVSISDPSLAEYLN